MIRDKNIFIKKISFVLGLFFLAVLGFFLILHYISSSQKSFLKLRISKNYITLKKVDYKFFKHGKLAYEIFSKNLNYFSPKKDIIVLHNVLAYVYDKKGKPKYIITGKLGRLNIITKNVKFSENVKIKNNKGSSYIITNLIYYFGSDQKVIAPNYIKIVGKKYIISGVGLTFFINKSIFIISKDVNFRATVSNIRAH
jgi:LPS export ABC transporter protein LptC